ncbi:MAG: DUF2023 family protein [Pontiella sp.]
MQVFSHHLYEYKKGLRNMVLHTIGKEHLETIIRRLDASEISFEIYPVGKSDRVNIFFGDSASIDMIQRIGKSNLNDYTPEEDFMLGIMLGYERKQQCERYLEQRNLWETKAASAVAC